MDVVVACNTAHLLIEELEDLLRKKPLSLIELTANKINESNHAKVGLLASPLSINSNLHRNHISNRHSIVTLDSSEQAITSEIIHKVLAGKLPYKKLSAQIQQLKNLGSDHIVLGCTELSVLRKHLKSELYTIIDPLDLAADKLTQ